MLTFNFHIYLRIVLILIISIMCKMNFYFRYQSVLNSSKLRKIVRMNRTHCRLVLCVPGFLTTFGFVNHSNKHFYFLYFIALALSISLTNSIFSIGWNSHSRHEHQSGKSSSNNHSARHSQPYPDEPPRLFHGKKYFFFLQLTFTLTSLLNKVDMNLLNWAGPSEKRACNVSSYHQVVSTTLYVLSFRHVS